MELEEENQPELIHNAEKEALRRRERLNQWRAQKLASSTASNPSEIQNRTDDAARLGILPEAIADVLAASHMGPPDSKEVVSSDLVKKAVNDDVIRFIKPKLELLSLRSEKAMLEHVRAQLGWSQNVDILSAVHVGSALVYGENGAEN